MPRNLLFATQLAIDNKPQYFKKKVDQKRAVVVIPAMLAIQHFVYSDYAQRHK